MIDSEFLALIRCPVDGQSLFPASDQMVAAINDQIRRGELRDASGGAVTEAFDAALLTVDRCRIHAIRGGIPTLIPGEAVTVPVELRDL